MPKRIKSLFVWLLFTANIIVSAALLIASLASHINPETTTIPAFFGLAFPFLFGLNIIFLLVWAVRRNKKVLPAIAVTLLALPTASRFLAMNFGESSSGNKQHKVLSFNVRNFDLYNWSSNKLTRNKIFDFLKQERADIICLQEFFNNTSLTDDFVTLDTIIKLQPARNYHTEYTSSLYSTQNWGIATFSIYPVVNRGRLKFDPEDHNICIYTDLKIDEDTIRVYNMHLASIRFKHSDYEFFDSISTKNNQEQISGSINLLRKLKTAFIKRSRQTEKVLNSIRLSPYPVVVCGDFNDTPASYTYGQITTNLQDAFMESGNGLGKTYIGSFPSFRIDYILHSRDLISGEFKTHREMLSDHYPVSCNIEIPKRDL